MARPRGWSNARFSTRPCWLASMNTTTSPSTSAMASPPSSAPRTCLSSSARSTRFSTSSRRRGSLAASQPASASLQARCTSSSAPSPARSSCPNTNEPRFRRSRCDAGRARPRAASCPAASGRCVSSRRCTRGRPGRRPRRAGWWRGRAAGRAALDGDAQEEAAPRGAAATRSSTKRYSKPAPARNVKTSARGCVFESSGRMCRRQRACWSVPSTARRWCWNPSTSPGTWATTSRSACHGLLLRGGAGAGAAAGLRRSPYPCRCPAGTSPSMGAPSSDSTFAGNGTDNCQLPAVGRQVVVVQHQRSPHHPARSRSGGGDEWGVCP